ncbi:hypothetical protein Tco_0751114 [Tanacetum coccineum]|uniref:Retrovirus-related Pol polyprotein from transposon TNT 1-94-like beta-barrel domain-containing protein n=1 Tax=Tanacetum coccineum TaxID=301880 RepID=A0ABQ4Z6L5_9ASTR
MVVNSQKHHCRVRPYTREVLVISTNLDIQKNHYRLDFRNRRGDEARIKNTWPKAVVNAVRPKAVANAIKRNNVNAVKASACWIYVSDGLGLQKKLIFLSNVQGNPQMDLQDQGVIDSGCSRHMTGNMSYLTDYEEIDEGYVAFGGLKRKTDAGQQMRRFDSIKAVDTSWLTQKSQWTEYKRAGYKQQMRELMNMSEDVDIRPIYVMRQWLFWDD